LHQISAEHTGEKAIAGVTSGLIGLYETVTWRARHFGITQTLTTEITALNRPTYFVDKMRKGAFRGFKHEHLFVRQGSSTVMKDVFDYQSPLGPLGRMVDFIILERYMRDFLIKRNDTIKAFAETERWKQVLKE